MLQSLKSPFDSNESHPSISKSSLRTSSGKFLPSTPQPTKHRVSTPYPKKEESSNPPDSFNAMVPLSGARSGSTSPPASLDVFNPFEGSAECFEVSDKVNDTRHPYRSTSSLSLTSTAHTCFSSPLRKWEEAFDDNIGLSCNSFAPSLFFSADFANSFESPFFDEIIAREIGSNIGLGLPSSTLVTLGDVRIREDVIGHDIEISDDQSRMPSWDFGDKDEKEWMSLSAWEKISRWSKGIELQEMASFAMGASALGAVYFSLYAYSRR